MEYKRFGDTIMVRMQLGEEITEQIKAVAMAENIKLAKVEALGATSEFTVGVYDVSEKVYHSNTFKGAYEIVSLTGSINTMNGEYYSHIHMAASDEKGLTFGGHLNSAIVCPTCEMFITVIDGVVDRVRDEEIGINLLKF